MAYEYPDYPGDVLDGDEASYSPHKTQHSLLATERGTDFTRRIETDGSNNLFVSVGALGVSVQAIAASAQVNVPDGSLTTIVTHTAATTQKVTRVSVGGTDYAKFQLFKNTVLIETRRSGPERVIDFRFDVPLGLASGDILDVKVTHFNTGVLADFEATIYGA